MTLKAVPENDSWNRQVSGSVHKKRLRSREYRIKQIPFFSSLLSSLFIVMLLRREDVSLFLRRWRKTWEGTKTGQGCLTFFFGNKSLSRMQQNPLTKRQKREVTNKEWCDNTTDTSFFFETNFSLETRPCLISFLDEKILEMMMSKEEEKTPLSWFSYILLLSLYFYCFCFVFIVSYTMSSSLIYYRLIMITSGKREGRWWQKKVRDIQETLLTSLIHSWTGNQLLEEKQEREENEIITGHNISYLMISMPRKVDLWAKEVKNYKRCCHLGIF